MPHPGRRFDRLARLLGRDALARLANAHVCVVGLGGVGSWTVEALARSGIGRLTLVDGDAVCHTNINRQIHALETTLGKPKVQLLADRVRLINPVIQAEAIPLRFGADTATRILAVPYACVVDAIDSVSEKARLIANCRENQLPILTSGGAGGRLDPTRVRVNDLAFTSHDRLLAQVRSALRQDYGFPRGQTAFGVPCVHSTEPPAHAPGDGSHATPEESAAQDADRALTRDRGLGTAAFVTGTFGFVLASLVVKHILAAGPSA